MNIWVVMLLGGILTFGMRLSFVYLFGRFDVPHTMRQALRFVPPSVLSAIILPQLCMPSGYMDLSFVNHRLLAGVVAVIVALFTKNTLLTILAGMASLLLLQLAF
jgi:branched-subunit amino acid transport protein